MHEGIAESAKGSDAELKEKCRWENLMQKKECKTEKNAGMRKCRMKNLLQNGDGESSLDCE